MYRIEMLIETGHWDVRVPANRAQAELTRRRVLRHNQYEWVATNERWAPLGGQYTAKADAEQAMAWFMRCGSRTKPLQFRCYQV